MRCMDDGSRVSCFNLSSKDMYYHVKVHVDAIKVMAPSVLTQMEKSLPFVPLCYLKTKERLKSVLKVRLISANVRHPVDGKLYVVFLVCKGVVAFGQTMAVDLWWRSPQTRACPLRLSI